MVLRIAYYNHFSPFDRTGFVNVTHAGQDRKGLAVNPQPPPSAYTLDGRQMGMNRVLGSTSTGFEAVDARQYLSGNLKR